MIHLIFALKTEALHLINSYQLKKMKNLPFTLYQNDNISLLITQMGLTNAKFNTEQYLKHTQFKENDILLNIGICAAPARYDVGEILFIDRLKYNENVINLTTLKHKEYKNASLITYLQAQDCQKEACADMEAYGVVSTALRYLPNGNIFVIKIVSDHYQPHLLTKESVSKMMRNKNQEIKDLIKEILCQQQ